MMSSDNQACALCALPANLMCQRCLESYCSVNCQVTDWTKHKLICIPMPQLIPNSASKLLTKKMHYNENKHLNLTVAPTNQMNNGEKNAGHNIIIKTAKDTENMRLPKSQTSDVPNDVTQNHSLGNCGDISSILGQIDNMNFEVNRKPINNIESYNEQNLFKSRTFDSGIKADGSNDGCKNQNDRYRIRSHFQNNSQNKNFKTVNERLNSSPQAKIICNSESKNTDNMKADKIIELNDKQLKTIEQNPIHNSEEKIPNLPVAPSVEVYKLPITSASSRAPWNIPFPLSEDPKAFVQVAVQYVDVSAKVIWVMSLSLESPATKLLKEIHCNITHEKLKLENTAVGSLVAAPFEEIYYRAIVIEKLNSINEVRVRLVDYGNDFLININQLKLPIPIMNNLNAYSFCCRYNKPTTMGKILNIRITGKESDDIFIIEEEIITPITKIEFKSILSILPNTFHINIKQIFGSKLNACVVIVNKSFQATLSKLNELLISEETFHYDLTEPAQNGDCVAARNSKWNRGVIIDQFNGKYLIYFIDTGMIDIVEQIKIIPKLFRDIPPQSVLIDIDKIFIDNDSFNKEYFYDLNTLTVKKLENSQLTPELTLNCDLYGDDKKLAKITISNFSGDITKIINIKGWYFPLANKDIVRITKVIDQSNLTICLDAAADIYTNLFNEIGNSAILKFEMEPNVGDVVLALTHDKMYVRSRILKKLEKNVYHVQNEDTGCDFNAAEIKSINNFIKFCPVYVMNVALDIINQLTLTATPDNKAIFALESYCSEQKKFLLDTQKNSSVVHLYFNDEFLTSLNKHLIPLLYETVNQKQNITRNSAGADILPEKDAELLKKPIYDISAITFKPLPVGENIKILVLDNSVLKMGMVAASAFDLEFLNEYYTEYQAKINAHCTSEAIKKEYMPQSNEVCFTFFDTDSQWYRSICLEKSKDMFTLLFLDFGNTQKVDKTYIREFDKDFLFPCITHTCIIDGLPEELPDNEVEKISQYMHANGAIVVDKIEMINDNYVLQIDAVKDLFKNK